MIKCLKSIRINTEYLFLLIYSFIIKMFNSFASPIFAENCFQADNDIFYVVGKSILRGKILYKDMIDNKTPYTYFINTIASVLGCNHLGLYIIESILLFVTLLYVYKIVKIYIESKYLSLFAASIFALFLTNSFITLGMSKTECYSLTFIIIIMHDFIEYYRGRNSFFSNKKLIKLGIFSGIVFMINMKHIAIPVGLYLILIIYLFKNKKQKELVNAVLYTAVGIIIAIVPYLIYMICTNSFKEAFVSIFVLPFSYIKSRASLYYISDGIIDSLAFYVSYNLWFFVLLIVSIVIVIIFEKNVYIKISFVLSLLFGIYITAVANNPYSYYLVILYPYLLPTIIVILILFKKLHITVNKNIALCSFTITIIVVFIINLFAGFDDIRKQYSAMKDCNNMIAKSINNISNDTKNMKLLAVGFIPEVYISVDNTIQFPCFVTMNNRYNGSKYFVDNQTTYIENAEPEVVVFNPIASFASFNNDTRERTKTALDDNYVLFDTIDTKTTNGTYLIYKRK